MFRVYSINFFSYEFSLVNAFKTKSAHLLVLFLTFE